MQSTSPDASKLPWWVLWVGSGAALSILVVSVSVMAPDAGFLDSSELTAASFGLGIAHPPGHPIPAILGRLFSFLPLGSIAFRVSLCSASMLALSGAGLVLAGHRLLAMTLRPGEPSASSGSSSSEAWLKAAATMTIAAAALTACLSGSALLQGVRAEVYALQLLTGVGVLEGSLGWLSTRRPRHLYKAGLWWGLSLANHHLLASAFLPALLAMLVHLLLRGKARGRRILITSSFVVLGLFALFYLPLRAARDPLVNWGDPQTFSRFIWTLSARIFMKTATRSIAEPMSLRAISMTVTAVLQLGIVASLLSVLGLYLGFRQRRTSMATLFLLLTGLATFTSAVMGGFDPTNPDSHGYLLMGLSMICLLAGAGLFLVIQVLAHAFPLKRRLLGRMVAMVLAACAVLYPFVRLPRALSFADQRQEWGSFELGGALLDQAPPGAVLMPGYYETTFALWYQLVVCGARPDLAVFYRYHLAIPGRAAQLCRTWPRMGRITRIDPKTRKMNLEALEALAFRVPVLVEPDNNPGDPLPFAASDPRIVGIGPLVWVSKGSWTGPTSQEEDRNAWNLLLALLEPLKGSEGVRRILLWRLYQSAWLWVAKGRCGEARWLFNRAWSLAPGDLLLKEMAKRCGFVEPKTP